MAEWGKVDILVNNAGILRDRSFAKMTLAEFREVVDVHLIGSAICTHAVWNHMRERQYGRIVFTSSSSGLYGNFGQANYGAAKMGVIGLMNVPASRRYRQRDSRQRAVTGRGNSDDRGSDAARGIGKAAAGKRQRGAGVPVFR